MRGAVFACVVLPCFRCCLLRPFLRSGDSDARDLDNIAYQRSRLEQMRQSLEDERRQARFSPPSRASSAFAMSPLAATPSTSSSMRRAPSPLLPPISGTPPSARQTQRRSGGSAASPAASVSAASPSRKPFATSAALPAADRREAQSRYAAELQAQIRARETLAAREPGDMGDECRARRQREELYRRELSRSVEAGAPRAVIPTAVRVSSLDDDSSLEQRRAKAAATRAMLDSGLAARDAARAAEPPAYRRPERYDEPYKLYAL